MKLSYLLILLAILFVGLLVVLILFMPSGDEFGAPGTKDLTLPGRDTEGPAGEEATSRTPRRPGPSRSRTPAVLPGGEGVEVDFTKATEALAPPSTGSGTESSASSNAETATIAIAEQNQSDDTAEGSSENKQEAVVGTISGAVYSGQRLPLAGVTVEAGGAVAMSDNAGKFTLEEVKGAEVRVLASREGYQTVSVDNVKVGTKNLSLMLIENGHLSGRVVDQFDKPVSYASVQLRALKKVWSFTVECDIGGSFEASNVPNGEIEITASRQGLTDAGEGQIVVNAPHPNLVVVRLRRPAYAISGFVRDARTGQGVSGFTLTAQKQDEEHAELKRAVTAGGGAYLFEDLEVGVYLVSSDTTANQHLNVAIPLKEDRKSVRVFEKDVTNVIFLAVPSFAVSGRVVGPGGEGIRGARVTLARQNQYVRPGALFSPDLSASGEQKMAEALSGSDGVYRLNGIPWPGDAGTATIQLFASHQQFGSGLSESFQVEVGMEHVENIEIPLAGSATLSGHVAEKQGEVLPGARVTLIDLFQKNQQVTTTDSTGAFSFEQVSITPERYSAVSGTHRLVVEKEGYATKEQDVLINSESNEPLMLLMERGGSIQGRVLGGRGQGVPGVDVTVVLPEGERRAGTTNDAGVYVVSGLKPGVYDLLFRLESKPPMYGSLYDVEAGTSNADVVLRPESWTVTGAVFEEGTEKRLTRYTLAIEGRLKDPEAGSFVKEEYFNTPDGSYSLTFHEPGIYYIHFAVDGYQPWNGAVAMNAQTQTLQFVNAWLKPLEQKGAIRGSVALPEGQGLALVRVLGHGDFPPISRTDFFVEEIPAGKHRVVLYVSDETGIGARILGALPEVEVYPDRETNLGVLDPSGFRATVRGIG